MFMIGKLVNKLNFLSAGVLVFIALFALVSIWLIFGELRTKVVKIEIDEKGISLSNYCGLGTKKVYTFSDFDGFETTLLPSKYNTYESLYLISNGKKVIKLSEYYHSNYADLKATLAKSLQYLGQKRFSLTREIKEIFVWQYKPLNYKPPTSKLQTYLRHLRSIKRSFSQINTVLHISF